VILRQKEKFAILPSGLSDTAARPDQFWTRDSPDVENIVVTIRLVHLAAGDFNNDG
jgi:hypothetical protein